MLRPQKKITRKEIKEDALVTFYVKLQKWMRSHIRKIYIGIGAAAILCIVGIFMMRSKKDAEQKSAEKLGVTEQFFYAKEYGRAIPDLNQIVDLYRGTQNAGIATFLLGNAYFDQADYENARLYFQKYIDQYSDNRHYTASSYAGLAACSDAKGNYDEAAQYFEKAAKKAAVTFYAPYYYRDAARCYQLAGNPEKAKACYQIIKEQFSKSSIAQEADFSLEALSVPH